MPKSTVAAVAVTVGRSAPASCNPLPRVARSTDKPMNRRGSVPVGAYPEVSRTLLASATGKHKSTISNILRGKQKPTLEVALVMAETMRVPIQVLEQQLARQRETYKEEKRQVGGSSKRR